MVARPSGVLSKHSGFQNIGLSNPVFTVENSAVNNPIHATHSKQCTHNMHGVKPTTAEHSPTVRPANYKLHKVKPAQILEDFRASAKR